MSSLKLTLQSPEQIAYFLGANNYCWLYFRNGEKKLLAKPLRYIETQLPDFVRVHRTVLLNPTYIRRLRQLPYTKGAGEVHLLSGEVFAVSRRRWPLLTQRLPTLPITASAHPEPAELSA